MPPSPSALANSSEAAWQLLALHRPELALQLAGRLLAADPAAGPVLLVRTEALRQLRRLPEATEAARAAVARLPQDARTHAALTRVLGQGGQLEGAEYAIREALRLDPHRAGYFALLAELRYLRQQPHEARAAAEAGLRLDAQHGDCLLWRALSHEQLRRPTAADRDFAALLRLAPTSYLTHLHQGRVLLARAEAAPAAAHLAEALRLHPTALPEVGPLLRQARQAQYWPGWFRRRHLAMQQQWQRERYLGWNDSATAALLPWFWLAAWWRTRHDPPLRGPAGWRPLLAGLLVLAGASVVGSLVALGIGVEFGPTAAGCAGVAAGLSVFVSFLNVCREAPTRPLV